MNGHFNSDQSYFVPQRLIILYQSNLNIWKVFQSPSASFLLFLFHPNFTASMCEALGLISSTHTHTHTHTPHKKIPGTHAHAHTHTHTHTPYKKIPERFSRVTNTANTCIISLILEKNMRKEQRMLMFLFISLHYSLFYIPFLCSRRGTVALAWFPKVVLLSLPLAE
jgi:hypothetical protein